MNSALFLDRDDTLVEDAGYMSDPGQIKLLPGVAEALRRAAEHFRLYLFTNQSGIGRGFYTMADAVACNERLIELLELPSPGFHGICIAPETPEQPPVYRKPSPRYILEAIERDNLDKKRCHMIGDRISDLESGLNAGIQSILIDRDAGEGSKKALMFAKNHSLLVFKNLPEAVNALIKANENAGNE